MSAPRYLACAWMMIAVLGIGCSDDAPASPQFGSGQSGSGGSAGGDSGASGGPSLPMSPEAGSGGTGGSAGSGGQPSIDPSDCQPGTYTGEFDCMFDEVDDFVVTGPVTITLEQGALGEFVFSVSDGELEASAVVFFGLRADIRGGLDCYSGEFTAQAENGLWAVGDPNAPLIPGGTFNLDLNGELDVATQSIHGPFVLDDPDLVAMLGICRGSWSATRVP